MCLKLVNAAWHLCITVLLLSLTACSSHSPSGSQDATTSPETSSRVVAEPSIRAATASYTVRPGDTLYSIAKQHGVQPRLLQSENNIDDPTQLRIGQILRIPTSINTQKLRFIWPLTKVDISSGFGDRNGRHKGVDLRAQRGSPIRAAASGVVKFVGRQRGYGKLIVIEHKDAFRTLYAHNLQNHVKKGQRVKQGETIATVGNSGNATGYHVHFEVIIDKRRVDPKHYTGN